MKIGYAINCFHLFGGAERQTIALMAEARKAGHQVIGFTLKNSDPKALEELRTAGVDTVHCLHPWSRGWDYWKALREVDVLHVNLFPSLYLFSIVPVPKIYTEHSTHNRRRNHPFLKPLERLAYSRYANIGCISDGVKGELRSWLGSSERMVVVPNGIILSTLPPREIAVPKRNWRLGMVGRFVAAKDQKSLVEALALLDESFTLSLVGDGTFKHEIEGLVQRLGLQDRVIFHGALTQVNPVLDEIDIFVQSSHYEGFGLAPLEAMTRGIPTIGSDVAGLAEILAEGMAFPAGKPESIAAMIRKMTSSAAEYNHAAMICKNRSAVFGVDATFKEYENLYSCLRR